MYNYFLDEKLNKQKEKDQKIRDRQKTFDYKRRSKP